MGCSYRHRHVEEEVSIGEYKLHAHAYLSILPPVLDAVCVELTFTAIGEVVDGATVKFFRRFSRISCLRAISLTELSNKATEGARWGKGLG